MLPKILIAIAIVTASYFGYTQFFAKTYISQDTTISGDYNPDPNKTVVFKNNATLTVEGNATVKNPIECQNSSININVKGNLSVSNKMNCQKKDEQSSSSNKTSTKGLEGVGIALAAEGSIEFTDNSSITSSGHILLVDNPDHFPKTEEDLAKLLLETGMDTNDGKMRVGPFGSDEEGEREKPRSIEQIFKSAPAKSSFRKQGGFELIKTASAKDDTIILNGDWKIEPPKKGVTPIFFVNFPGKSLEINGSISLPRGRNAETIKGGCEVNVEDAEQEDKEKNHGKKNRQKDAARVRFRAEKVTIGNFTINLGDGGKGADAETDPCGYAVAVGGTGGKSGNLKITAGTEIVIRDKFTIMPGKGGRGGNAKAFGIKGENADPGEQGGHALAAGGYGADNIKKLKSLGDVKGLDKIFIGSLVGGDGGDGIANPGDGGDGDVCDSKGGNPGQGLGEESLGGAPFLEIPPQVKRTEGAKDELGKDGEVIVNDAKVGKDGPPCDGDENGQTETLKKVDSTPPPTNSPKKSTSNSKTIGTFSGIVGTTEVTLFPHPGITVSDYTPLKVEVKVGGKLVWQTTINKSDCKETPSFPGCNVPGYKYSSDWDGLTLEMKAYDQDGILRASTYNKSATPWRPSCSGSDCPPPFAQPLP